MIDIGPRHARACNCINANAQALARYAALCQEASIVPIVEPEVLMDGPVATHDIDTCYAVTEWMLKTVFQELYVRPRQARGHGAQAEHGGAGQEQRRSRRRPPRSPRRPSRVLKAMRAGRRSPASPSSPAASRDEEATEHSSLMNAHRRPLPWTLTFSYGRALQAAAIKAWGGKAENVAAGAARLPPPRPR